MIYDLETTLSELPGEPDVRVTFKITLWPYAGCGASWNHPGDPPEPPEWELVSVIEGNNVYDWTKFSEQTQAFIENCVYEKIHDIYEDANYDYEG